MFELTKSALLRFILQHRTLKFENNCQFHDVTDSQDVLGNLMYIVTKKNLKFSLKSVCTPISKHKT